MWAGDNFGNLGGNIKLPRQKVCKILSHIVMHIIEGAILHLEFPQNVILK